MKPKNTSKYEELDQSAYFGQLMLCRDIAEMSGGKFEHVRKEYDAEIEDIINLKRCVI